MNTSLLSVSSLLLLGATFCAVPSVSAAEPVTAGSRCRLILVGDSTVQLNPPGYGWGQFIQERFSPAVEVLNHAQPGRSTKTFRSEGRWDKVLELKPDFILIQFGHNDSHAPEKPEAVPASPDYKDNLRRFIDEARAIGAKPILVTSVCRRIFGKDGLINNSSLQPYVDAMKEVAREKEVPLIDLSASSKAYFDRLGAQASDALGADEKDKTHFNEAGARAMADLVMRELPAMDKRLQTAMVTPAK